MSNEEIRQIKSGIVQAVAVGDSAEALRLAEKWVNTTETHKFGKPLGNKAIKCESCKKVYSVRKDMEDSRCFYCRHCNTHES